MDKIKNDKVLKVLFMPGISFFLLMYIIFGGYFATSVKLMESIKMVFLPIYFVTLIVLSLVIIIRLLVLFITR
ncbi:hypothetical protein [Clostridium sp.]|uniref:hypothetical protein n=1 Tax=Clostridium sp. TaxID=1506 RepID=UPI0032166848